MQVWRTTQAVLYAVPVLVLTAPGVAYAAAGKGKTGLDGLAPDPTAIPGGKQAKELIDGIMFYGLVVATIALVASAAWMGVGKMRRNPAHVESGQTGVMWAMAGAVLIGGTSAFVSWAFKLGLSIQP